MLIADAQIRLWNAGNPTTPRHRQIPAYIKAAAFGARFDCSASAWRVAHRGRMVPAR